MALRRVEILGLQRDWCANLMALARVLMECVKVARETPGCVSLGILCPLQLSNFSLILQIFAWGGIFCPLQLGNFLALSQISARGGIVCPLQLGNFWQFLKVLFRA
jgi:hypothetical protein